MHKKRNKKNANIGGYHKEKKEALIEGRLQDLHTLSERTDSTTL